MTSPPQITRQLLTLLRQHHTQATDERHLKTLSGMVAALILSGQVSLSAWVPYLCSRAQQALCYQRRSFAVAEQQANRRCFHLWPAHRWNYSRAGRNSNC